jgi:3-oxoacyl-[acyl-carrier-protein] synthase-3
MDIRITSATGTLSGPPVSNADLARRFKMDTLWEEWIDAFIGTRTRYLTLDLTTGERRHSLADLCTMAGREALDRAGLGQADVDLLVLATATPDLLVPATVNIVADRLGIDEVPTFQLQSGCAGAVQALYVARQMLLGGQHHTALVIGGDVSAKHFDLNADLRELPPDQLVNVALFGDGAGAAVLTTGDTDGPLLLRVLNRLVGLNRPPGQVLEWFGLADLDGDHVFAREDYKSIEASVPAMATEILKELLDDLGWTKGSVTHLLPPQLSGRMAERITKSLALPKAEEITFVADTGNIGNATPFLQLERALQQMTTGDRALAIAVESSKWIKSGFALEKT